MIKFYYIFFVFIFLSYNLFSQKYTVSGYVREKSTGESLIGANVYIKNISVGTTANHYGFYSLTLAKGEYDFTVSFIGYKDYTQHLVLNKDIKLNVSLEENAITTKEIIISGEKSDKNVKNVNSGTVNIPIETIKNLPAFLGEVDILKSIQLLPGVQSAGEGNSGFYVRGGGPDQNLILLDEAVVYNASHLFGFFSVFNADAVKDINLIKGGMPANYGGRLSSVLDISMKDGNNQKYDVEGGIGLISSRLTVQGPIIKDTSSFIVTARRTYIDVLVEPFVKNTSKLKGTGYYFYDVNMKANYRFSDKDKLFLSGYFGRDVFTYKNKKDGFNVRIPWGNTTTSLRWNHLFSDKLFLNTTATYSNYKFEFQSEQSDFEFKLFSGVTDYNFKVDFNYFPTVRHNIKFGANYIYHIFIPSSATARIGGTDFDTGKILKQYANDYAIYVNDEFDVTDKLKINAGIRGTMFQQIGPFNRYKKNESGVIVDTIMYSKGKIIAEYKHIEPRISIRYTLNSSSSLKASYTQNYQYIHLASVSSVSLPTDIWVPSSDIVKPQFATLYSFGYFKNFLDNMFETSVEVYYKTMENQIDYKEGASPTDDVGDNSDNNFTFGSGKSYGIELFFKKKAGNFTGWIGYTLSKTTRLFAEINNGKEYPAKYDRTHDLSVVLSYELSKKWTFSTVFIYATGSALTLPIARYMIDSRIINEYGPRNSFRMAPYHRMDISATYAGKQHKRYQSSWNFAIFNVYNRYNPYFIYFVDEGNLSEATSNPKAKQVSLFPILPSITWNFKF